MIARIGVAEQLPLQRSPLRVGAVEHPLEKEANEVADRVMRMPVPTVGLIQRCPGGCPDEETLRRQVDEEEEELLTQRLPESDAGTAVLPEVASAIQARRGGGDPLPLSTRRFFEPRLGIDFSEVRVHNDSQAARLAGSINARAFTIGPDLFFGSGQWSPDSSTGSRLIAHELAHTMQQAGKSDSLRRSELEDGEEEDGIALQLAYGGIIQRASNPPPETVPSPGGLACDPATTSAGGLGIDVDFGLGSASLTAPAKAALSNLANNWHASGTNDLVRIDGFASADGAAVDNWHLSCRRAQSVRSELLSPSAGSSIIPVSGIPASHLDMFANGETDQFSDSLAPNRRATVHIPAAPPVPPTSPSPPFVDRWVVRTATGMATSADNCCALCPRNLGLNARAGRFVNGIELKPIIKNHTATASYDIKRTANARAFRRMSVLGSPFWAQFFSAGPGHDDDSHNADECLAPIPSGSEHHLYVEDQPGFPNTANPVGAPAATEGVLISNFTEFVEITDPVTGSLTDANTQDWHVVVWVTRSGATWSMDLARSTIAIGHRATLRP